VFDLATNLARKPSLFFFLSYLVIGKGARRKFDLFLMAARQPVHSMPKDERENHFLVFSFNAITGRVPRRGKLKQIDTEQLYDKSFDSG
jgi:hypothetical protein